jgi:pimeloyl-ACP methyl ester carboxylesterase
VIYFSLELLSMTNHKNVIYLPGLGADHRLFNSLKKKIPGKNYDYPNHDNQPNLAEYARKCIKTWNLKPPFLIIGFSFGGIVGKEILKQFNTNEAELLMLSSCRSHKSIDNKFKFTSKILYLIPNFILRLLLVYVGPYFAKRSDLNLTKDNFELLKEMAKDVNLSFFRWSVKQCRDWKEIEEFNLNLYQIHGELDSVIPIAPGIADYTIPGGQHLICYTHTDEIKNQFNIRFNK